MSRSTLTALRLGLRLAVAGRHEALLRLAVTAVGVGVGVALLLLSLTAQSAFQGSAERSGWRSADSTTPATAPDQALFLSVTDYHDTIPTVRAYVAALGPRPPVPPGLERLPGPGEVAASPAMRRLLEATPDDQLDDRFPGQVTATIGDEGLAHRDELVAIIGRTPEQLREVRSQSLHTVRGFGALPSGYAFVVVLRAILLVGAVLLLVPVVVFIVMATRVAASQREQRLAAIRMVGATRPQAAAVAAVETGLAATAGSVLGWIGYEGCRRILAATVTFAGGRPFVEDVFVAPWVLVLVLVGVPVLTMLTTVVALSRVKTGPLSTSWRIRRPPPSAWTVLPVAVGIGGQLAGVPLRGVLGSDVVDRLTPVFAATTIVGLVAAGPWLVMLTGRGIARVSRRAPGLIAARRIAAEPGATFRAVAGVVLAAFTVTYSASLIDPSETAPYSEGPGTLRPGVVEVYTAGVPEAQVAPLLSAHAVATRGTVDSTRLGESCRELARVVVQSCPLGTGEAAKGITAQPGLAHTDLPVSSVYVLTDGTPATENRIRTQAANLVPNAIVHTQGDRDNASEGLRHLEGLMRIGWHFVLLVAACSLTVGMLAGVVERRRPFALLRASGLRLGELRQVVVLETAAPMLVTSVVGVGLGLGASYTLAQFGDMAWAWPDHGVFTMVGLGVLTALVLSTLALPLLNAATRHHAVRFE